MEELKLEQLHKLLEKAEEEKDTQAAAALRWALHMLEDRALY